MQYNQLGSSTKISKLCLGTMTWGEQNTQEEAFTQLDFAIDHGINFIDTAELYAVPPRAETYTATESILGKYLNAKGSSTREKLVIASKIAGKSPHLNWIRDGKNCFTEKNIISALEGSLKRLNIDYIDLYQLHWPDRKTNYFGQLGFKAPQHDDPIEITETLQALKKLLEAGKIRYYGLSNETAWGTMKFLQIAKELNMPAPVTIQNPYNLLNRTFEVGLAEVAHQEEIGLMAYSPLAFGALTGKYLNKKKPNGARLTLFASHFKRYLSELAVAATTKYTELAQSINLTAAELALAFVYQQPFVISTIIGATTVDQLQQNINTANIKLDKNTLKEIEKIHLTIPNPAP